MHIIHGVASHADASFTNMDTRHWRAQWLGTDGRHYEARHAVINDELMTVVEAYDGETGVPETSLLPPTTNVLELVLNGDSKCEHPKNEVYLRHNAGTGIIQGPRRWEVVCSGCGEVLAQPISEARLLHDAYWNFRSGMDGSPNAALVMDTIKVLAELDQLDRIEP